MHELKAWWIAHYLASVHFNGKYQQSQKFHPLKIFINVTKMNNKGAQKKLKEFESK